MKIYNHNVITPQLHSTQDSAKKAGVGEKISKYSSRLKNLSETPEDLELDLTGIVGTAEGFDPLANFSWVQSIARSWREDATVMTFACVMLPVSNCLLDLTNQKQQVQWTFYSPSLYEETEKLKEVTTENIPGNKIFIYSLKGRLFLRVVDQELPAQLLEASPPEFKASLPEIVKAATDSQKLTKRPFVNLRLAGLFKKNQSIRWGWMAHTKSEEESLFIFVDSGEPFDPDEEEPQKAWKASELKSAPENSSLLLDLNGMSGSLNAFDPIANHDWIMSFARAWSDDIIFKYMDFEKIPTATGSLDLSDENQSVSWVFYSPERNKVREERREEVMDEDELPANTIQFYGSGEGIYARIVTDEPRQEIRSADDKKVTLEEYSRHPVVKFPLAQIIKVSQQAEQLPRRPYIKLNLELEQFRNKDGRVENTFCWCVTTDSSSDEKSLFLDTQTGEVLSPADIKVWQPAELYYAPVDSWFEIDKSELDDGLATFDPITYFRWALHVARTWSEDAALERFEITKLSLLDARVDTTKKGGSVEWRFYSESKHRKYREAPVGKCNYGLRISIENSKIEGMITDIDPPEIKKEPALKCSLEDICNIVRKKYNKLPIYHINLWLRAVSEFFLLFDRSYWSWDISFSFDKEKYTLIIDPETGKVIRTDIGDTV